MAKEVFTTFEVSRMLKVNPTTVQNWVKRGDLEAFATPGGHRRILKKNLLDFINRFGFPLPNEFIEPEKKILIVDDEVDVLRFIKKGLKRILPSNWTYFAAENGMDALLLYGENMPECVILDVRLPDMNGIEVCRKMKSKNPDSCIIAISGKASREEISEIELSGADFFLEKPFGIQQLKNVIKLIEFKEKEKV